LPFTARCVRCGYIVMANKRKTLDLLMEDHDSHSHESQSEWKIAIVSHREYTMLANASKISAFWKAINTRLK